MTDFNPYDIPPSRILKALAANRNALASLVNRYAGRAFSARDDLLDFGAKHGKLDSIEAQARHAMCRHWEGVATGLSLALAAIDSSQRGGQDARIMGTTVPVNAHPLETEVDLLAEVGAAAKRRGSRVANSYPEAHGVHNPTRGNCPECNGLGETYEPPDDHAIDCPACQGTGNAPAIGGMRVFVLDTADAEQPAEIHNALADLLGGEKI